MQKIKIKRKLQDFFPVISQALELKERIILFVGRFSPEKQPLVFVLAIYQLLKLQATNFKVVMAGDGPEYHKVKSLITELKLEGYITLPGSQTSAQVKDWMTVADILTMTSSTEGTPLVTLEALSMGLAIVAPNVGGISCKLF